VLKKIENFGFLWGIILIGSILINKIFEIGNLKMVFYIGTIFGLVLFFLYAMDESSDASLFKVWQKISTTFFMVVSYLLLRLLFGYLFDLPLSSTFQYFFSLDLLKGNFSLIAGKAFLFDTGLLIVICGSWAKFPCDPEKLQQFAMWCGSTIAIFAVVIAGLQKISPIALRRILGWCPQLNGLIGNLIPTKLTYGWLGAVAVIGGILFLSFSKGEKTSGKYLTGWAILLIFIWLVISLAKGRIFPIG